MKNINEDNTVVYSPKSRMKSLLFSSLLGMAGIHSYYLGHILAGAAHSILLAIMIVCTVIQSPWVALAALIVNFNWTLYEVIIISTGHARDAYQLRVRNWKSTRRVFDRKDYVINDWDCPCCGKRNYAAFAFCKKCGTSKENNL